MGRRFSQIYTDKNDFPGLWLLAILKICVYLRPIQNETTQLRIVTTSIARG